MTSLPSHRFQDELQGRSEFACISAIYFHLKPLAVFLLPLQTELMCLLFPVALSASLISFLRNKLVKTASPREGFIAILMPRRGEDLNLRRGTSP